ncbi:MAG: RagB/SusD family nutrient uptake outer membrane protein [Saprospiraceae bacterium]|nr:RagB/SusD family nutrient uptake outer membrane protein [Saprospiraceae bacterium]
MKYFKYIILVIFGLTIHSCDTEEFLNPLPDSAIVVETFFATDADVLAGIMGIYDAIQGVNENTETNITRANRGIQFEYMLSEMRSDNTRTKTLEGTKADFHRYRVDANNVQSEDYYQSMYQVIFRANNILNFIDVAEPANQGRYMGEAKFLRAFAYFKLVRLYGDVPLVTSVVGPAEDESLFTRVSASQIYGQIAADLQDAIDNLDNQYKSRASKGAAQGLLAKVYLTQDNPDYAGAASLCEAVINSAEYALEDNFYDVFYNELNDEILFAVQYELGNPLESQSFSAEFTAFSRQGREDGHNIVNENLIEDFKEIGGNRTDLSYKLFGDLHEVIKFLPGGSDISSFPPTYGPSPRDAGNDWIVLRLADVYLMHAEALMGGAPETSNSSAIDSYMAVRERAGFDPASDRPSSLTKVELLRERRVELAFENQRFYDLLRFGFADEIISAHATEMGYTSYSARKLFLPIPAREINLSGGLLTQNPGY